MSGRDDLAALLRDEHEEEIYFGDGLRGSCSCGWSSPYADEDYSGHIADVVLEWLRRMAAGDVQQACRAEGCEWHTGGTVRGAGPWACGSTKPPLCLFRRDDDLDPDDPDGSLKVFLRDIGAGT